MTPTDDIPRLSPWYKASLCFCETCGGDIIAWCRGGLFQDGSRAQCSGCKMKGRVFVDCHEAHFAPDTEEIKTGETEK